MKLVKQQGGVFWYLQATDKSQPCWYYLKVDPLKFREFKRELFQDNIKLTDYGEILYSGWGETPPQEIVETMKIEYDFE